MFYSASDAKYHGYKDICLFCVDTLNDLFPLPSPTSTSHISTTTTIHPPSTTTTRSTNHVDSKSNLSTVHHHPSPSSSVSSSSSSIYQSSPSSSSSSSSIIIAGDEDSVIPPIDEWLAYVFYRTNVQSMIVFHALRLLERLSTSYSLMPSLIDDPLLHHRLIFSALVLAFCYNMDDAYSNKSFSKASKGIFDTKEIDSIQFQLFQALDFKIGEFELEKILKDYSKRFQKRLFLDFERSKESELLRKLEECERRVESLINLDNRKILIRRKELERENRDCDDGRKRRIRILNNVKRCHPVMVTKSCNNYEETVSTRMEISSKSSSLSSPSWYRYLVR